MSVQGQSRATTDKQRCIGSALSIGIKIASAGARKRSWSRFNFWHFDANAGSGWNDTVNVPGSPLVFHAMADEHLSHLTRAAFFCDKNETALERLQSRLAANRSHLESSFLIPGDNEEALEVFGDRIANVESPQHAIGCVIIDPNGYWYRDKSGIGAPTRITRLFAQAFPKIDLVLNLNTRFYKMARSHAWGSDIPSPREVLASLHKQHWLVRRTQVGGDEFMLAVGRNTPTGDHRAIGMHRLESAEGQHILAMVEGGRQGKLPYEAAPLHHIRGIPGASSVPGGEGDRDAAGQQ